MHLVSVYFFFFRGAFRKAETRNQDDKNKGYLMLPSLHFGGLYMIECIKFTRESLLLVRHGNISACGREWVEEIPAITEEASRF